MTGSDPDSVSASGPDGSIEVTGDGQYRIHFQRRLRHSVQRVWAALTEPGQLVEWLAAVPEIDLREGGHIGLLWQNALTAEEVSRYRIVGVDPTLPPVPVEATITHLDPPRLIEYATERHGLLRWELRAEGEACVLTLTATMTWSGGPDLTQQLAGWHMHLDLLDATLGGRATDWASWPISRWADYRDRYAADLSQLGGGLED